jgi:YYY domain-containing protein
LLDAVLWLIGIEVIGLVAIPLAFLALGGLKDRGLTLAKPLGMLLIGYLTWILSAAHILPNAGLGPQVALGLLAAVAVWIVYKRGDELLAHIRSQWKALVVAELVFLAVFIGWTLYRAFDPAISHTEQPMDLAFLNASMRADFAPPEDPWLRGEAVSYYYFGFWMMGVLGNLTGVVSSVAYNLSLAVIPAMAAAGAVGLVYNLVTAAGGRIKIALASGVLAALLLVAAANLEGVLEFMRANGMGSARLWDWLAINDMDGPAPQLAEGWRPNEFWWWWRSSRVINTFEGGQGIDFTIQEFPFFSALLGDLHPHFMSLPFVVLFLALCANFMASARPLVARVGSLAAVSRRQGRAVAAGAWLRGFAPGLPSLALIALALGGLGFINVWDLPVFAAVFLGVAALRAYVLRGPSLRDIVASVVPIGAVVIGLAFIFYLPYFGSFQSQFSGIRPVVEATTRPVHFLIVWGLLLVAVVPMLVSGFWSARLDSGWRRTALTSLAIGFAPFIAWLGVLAWGSTSDAGVAERFFQLLPLALLISVGAYAVLWMLKALPRGVPGFGFAMALGVFGLLLLLGPELVFVGDQFGTRMNTVFKFYYQAWILLSLAGGFALYYWASRIKVSSGYERVLSTVWAGGFCLLLVAALYYPAAALGSKPDLPNRPAGLDGLAHLAVGNPDELEAIEFLRNSVDGDSAILEAVGGSYTEFGRVSSATGIPTVLGWPGHERQWRGTSEPFDGREDDVKAIYQSTNPEIAKNLLGKYDVEYVYVGPRERRAYGTEGIDKFEEFMVRVFANKTVTIYRLSETVLGEAGS